VIIGGATLGRAYIAAGLVDEIVIHIVPVLFGTGTRMFEDMGIGHLQLEPIEVVDRPLATHIRYRPSPALDRVSDARGTFHGPDAPDMV